MKKTPTLLVIAIAASAATIAPREAVAPAQTLSGPASASPARTGGPEATSTARPRREADLWTPSAALVALSIVYVLGAVLAVVGAAAMAGATARARSSDQRGIALAAAGFALQTAAALAFLASNLG